MGSAAVAAAPVRAPEPVQKINEMPGAGGTATAVAQATQVQSEPPILEQSPADAIERARNSVLRALTDNAQNFLTSLLSSGEWSLAGNELVIKIAESQTVLDMSLSN